MNQIEHVSIWLKAIIISFFERVVTVEFFFSFFLMAAPMAHGSSQARDLIQAAAVTYAGSFKPLHLARGQTQTFAATHAAAAGFLTHCTTAGTPPVMFVPMFLLAFALISFHFYEFKKPTRVVNPFTMILMSNIFLQFFICLWLYGGFFGQTNFYYF